MSPRESASAGRWMCASVGQDAPPVGSTPGHSVDLRLRPRQSTGGVRASTEGAETLVTGAANAGTAPAERAADAGANAPGVGAEAAAAVNKGAE